MTRHSAASPANRPALRERSHVDKVVFRAGWYVVVVAFVLAMLPVMTSTNGDALTSFASSLSIPDDPIRARLAPINFPFTAAGKQHPASMIFLSSIHPVAIDTDNASVSDGGSANARTVSRAAEPGGGAIAGLNPRSP